MKINDSCSYLRDIQEGTSDASFPSSTGTRSFTPAPNSMLGAGNSLISGAQHRQTETVITKRANMVTATCKRAARRGPPTPTSMAGPASL